jgi:hypothetical protein
MTFSEYFGEPFRGDLNAVISALPSGHDHDRPTGVTIQPRTISDQNQVIQAWNAERRDLFASALFFTVLVDQVCYTHFRTHYPAFQALTLYPKFRGDCPGGCYHHLDPSAIFRALGSPHGSATGWRGEARIVPAATEAMRSEVLSFFADYMPAVDGPEFWRICSLHIPR